MRALHRSYGLAAILMICLHAAPASAEPARDGTLVRIIDGKARVGAAQPARSNSASGDAAVATTLNALKTRVSARVWPGSYENAPFQPVVPIARGADPEGSDRIEPRVYALSADSRNRTSSVTSTGFTKRNRKSKNAQEGTRTPTMFHPSRYRGRGPQYFKSRSALARSAVAATSWGLPNQKKKRHEGALSFGAQEGTRTPTMFHPQPLSRPGTPVF